MNQNHIANPNDLNAYENFINRELSLIEFQRRVLHEAEDLKHPLLERLKFAAILSSNLDEFFMIRVAGLKSQVASDVVDLSYDGMTPRDQLLEIRRRLLPIYKKQEDLLRKEIFPEMEKNEIFLHHYGDLNESDKSQIRKYFEESVLPALTPISIGPSNPFPRLINRSLNIAFSLIDEQNGKDVKHLAILQVPPVLPRFIKLERSTGYHFVLIEEVIAAFSGLIFPGLELRDAHTFRVTRDADIEIAEDEAEDLLSEMSEQLKKRNWGRAAVRLEVRQNMPQYLVSYLMNTLELEPSDVYVLNRPLNLGDFMDFLKLDIRELKDTPFAPNNIPEFVKEDTNIFDEIKKSDFLVHHPFDSFSTSVLQYVNAAVADKDVLALKITLYRTGMNSDIVAALKKAAENGKYVTAFVELKARFDEEKNIVWAKELENAGVHVVYGVPGLKTHCKICMVVRSEEGKLKTYLHLATGNYNQVTAKLYTDIGLFTANDDFGVDATYFMNLITSYSHYDKWRELIVAPADLRDRILGFIDREIEKHTPDNPGLIIAKMNSLAHREVIPALYKASQNGVKIKLIVRGICCLKPGVPGLSDNIEVRSILGRFLEHTRIFYFKNGGDDEMYLSSADWMSRNLHRRVELMFPVHDPKLKNRLIDILNCYLKDNSKAWALNPDGSYTPLKTVVGETPFCAQEYFIEETKNKP